MVLLPILTSKQLTQWQGPFEIVCLVGSMDYEVHQLGHQREKQIYHVNLLREWKELEGWLVTPEGEKEDLGPMVRVKEVKVELEEHPYREGTNPRSTQGDSDFGPILSGCLQERARLGPRGCT